MDIHAHVITPACLELVKGLMEPEYEPFSYWAGKETNEYQAGHMTEILPKATDPAVRIADMDAMGIDVQAISVAPPQYYYWTDVELGRKLARMQNENLASMVEDNPDRFVGLATVPLQDVSSAVAELEYRVRDLGFRGAEINTNVFGLDLDDRRFRPFFAKAEELDVPVMLHPNGFTHGERQKYYMTNVIGNPLDTTVAINRIIHGGVLEDHPALKLVLVHGGGFLPFYSSRIDHSYEQRPEGRHHITRPRAPSSRCSSTAWCSTRCTWSSSSSRWASTTSSSAPTTPSTWATTTRWARSTGSAGSATRTRSSSAARPPRSLKLDN